MKAGRIYRSFFYLAGMKSFSVNCNGKPVFLDEPRIMAIVNITPDSFYEPSRAEHKNLIRQVEKHLEEGATWIDIGGYSTRPGAREVPVEEEEKRVIPAIRLLIKHFPDIQISVDTFRSSIARKAVEEGACMVNDVSGGELDPKMFETVAKLKVPYILTHIQGTPQTMQQNPQYENVVLEINRFFARKIEQLHEYGQNDIIIDPGFGFGKSLDHNYEILKKLEYFQWTEKPLLVGMSRKSMLFKLLNGNPEEMLNATTVVNTIALLKKAHILRVHDVKPAMEIVKIISRMEKINA